MSSKRADVDRSGWTTKKCWAVSRSRWPEQCGNPPMHGLKVCYYHGGSTPQARPKYEKALAQHKATQHLARFGISRRKDTDPISALLDLVSYQSTVVDYWRERIEEVGKDDLEWGVTSIESGLDKDKTTNLTTETAEVHIAYKLLVEAQDKLATYASAALKAGVEQRQIDLAERYGVMLAEVIRRVLGDLNLSDAQKILVGEVVPRHLRALAAESSTGLDSVSS